jgi:hypothetical protein
MIEAGEEVLRYELGDAVSTFGSAPGSAKPVYPAMQARIPISRRQDPVQIGLARARRRGTTEIRLASLSLAILALAHDRGR